MVVFEVEIYLIELSPWSYNSSLGAVLSFSVPILTIMVKFDH